ncbi:MAG: hypothetical protein JNM25_10805 [Planctomycetes bacterium]|nr:hypothetical protein [Planctomycetota bacterium]
MEQVLERVDDVFADSGGIASSTGVVPTLRSGMAGCRRRGMATGEAVAGRRIVDDTEPHEPRLEVGVDHRIAHATQARGGFVGMAEPKTHLREFAPDLVRIEASFDGTMQGGVALLRGLLGGSGMTLELHGISLGCRFVRHFGSGGIGASGA